jgi:transposase
MTKKEFLDKWINGYAEERPKMDKDLDELAFENVKEYLAMTERTRIEQNKLGVLEPEHKRGGTLNEWKPTHRLRWHRYNVKEILQQLWKDEFGNLEWRDVPVEDE